MSFTASIAHALYDWHSRPTMSHGTIVLRPRTLVDRLPNELLTTIFIFSIEQSSSSSSPHDSLTTTTSCLPTTLSHVCRRWYLVALASGALWTSLVLTYPTSPHQFTRLLTFLSRAQNHPLAILLDVRDPDWDFELPEDEHGFTAQDMQLVLKLLFAGSGKQRRWRSVELLADTWAPIHAFLAFGAGNPGPGLEKLVLARCNAYFARKGQTFEPATLNDPLPLFGITSPSCDDTSSSSSPPNSPSGLLSPTPVLPKLQHVSLVGVHIDWSAAHIALCGGNLTTLELKYHASDVRPSIAQFARILAACPILETLAVVGSGPSFPPPSSISQPLELALPTIVLPSLTFLTLGFVDPHEATRLLALLRLPALTQLTLEDVGRGLHMYDDAVVFGDFLRDGDEDDDDAAAIVLDWLCDNDHDNHDDSDERIVPLALSQLTALTLDAIAALSPASKRLFGKCPSVRELALDGVDLGAALTALGLSSRNGERVALVPMPNLARLVCRRSGCQYQWVAAAASASSKERREVQAVGPGE
ncbi:hypothetical protein C8F01DRAFT_1138129 [Mycena amicta]|nr:hypothetical protein C8F01DRAFT_1138129 [Mycena amicta]